MAESDPVRPTAVDTAFTAQVERRPDGSLVAALYREGRRVHEQSVRSLRQGKRRAYDLLCTAVDTGGAAFPMLLTESPVESVPSVQSRLPQQFVPDRNSDRDPTLVLTSRAATVVWSAHAGVH